MKAWSLEELALLWRHNNTEVAASKRWARLQANLERNGWDKNDPAAVTKWEAA